MKVCFPASALSRFYHIVEFSSLGGVALAIYLLKFKYGATYSEDKDVFGNFHIPSEFGVVYIIVPCFLLACLMHPNLNKDFLSDMSWTFSMYLESLAIAPQLFMFTKQAEAPIEVGMAARVLKSPYYRRGGVGVG